MTRTAVITGAGSGVGQAIALTLARQAWRIVIVGRRAEALQQTIELAGRHAAQITALACDVSDPVAVAAMGSRVLEEVGEVDVLVNAAGTNAPRRSLEVLSPEDYHATIATNMHGAYYCLQAFLPQMRSRKHGTIINIVSEAGKQASPKAGPAYVMSKFGMAGLTQCINAEERANGIRACGIFAGDIDTALLDRRPRVPDAAARSAMMRAEDVAECAVFCINTPSHVIIEELLVRPR